jgi:hypothetical protein
MARKFHAGFPSTAVLDDVSQRFLNDSKDAESYLLRNRLIYLMMKEVSLDAVLSREFSAKTCCGRHKTQSIQLRRMEFVRQIMNIG